MKVFPDFFHKSGSGIHNFCKRIWISLGTFNSKQFIDGMLFVAHDFDKLFIVLPWHSDIDVVIPWNKALMSDRSNEAYLQRGNIVCGKLPAKFCRFLAAFPVLFFEALLILLFPA